MEVKEIFELAGVAANLVNHGNFNIKDACARAVEITASDVTQQELRLLEFLLTRPARRRLGDLYVFPGGMRDIQLVCLLKKMRSMVYDLPIDYQDHIMPVVEELEKSVLPSR